MNKSRLLGALCACLVIVSINANAVVLNTLNGVDYEWLELTATAGMSRLEVEAQLWDENSALYGYQYASRALVEDLLLSYSTWDGLNGWHGASSVLIGLEMYLDDFGRLNTVPGDGINDGVGGTFTTVDGFNTLFDGLTESNAYYGSAAECGAVDVTCHSYVGLYTQADGTLSMANQSSFSGWFAGDTSPNTASKSLSTSGVGSHLVKVASVPLPAAVWLFGSGLLGLFGIARRRK